MRPATLPGTVTRLQSGFVTVRTDQGVFTCHLRGRLKRTNLRVDVLAIGDSVQISPQPDGSAMIEEIAPRSHALVRLDPTPKGDYQQVLLANPDQVLLVFACANPVPHLRMLDRFLVICEKQGISVHIIANKVDLVGEQPARDIFGMYPSIGYPVLYTSVVQQLGLAELRALLTGKTSGLAGPSGVGKSSLLNALQPELGLAVRETSQALEKGRHTTNVRQMYPLNEGGFVIDLPGLRALSLWDTQPEELDGYFPELRDLVAYCQYNDCTHRHEAGCAVRAAVSEGRVYPERYESYLRLRYGDDYEPTLPIR
jgi:ribosome biogenesis GTPase / thiamine phosphate phosphatase